ncbi:MAG: thioredoxin family protein [Bacteroidota bacterium]|nr:thioredoxin family protein [Bacteroidota bacterium]
MRALINLFFSILIISGAFFPEKTFGQVIKYHFEQLDSLQNRERRTVVIFIHTDWCKYCHAMQNISLKNMQNISTLNNYYYFVDLNAEEKKDIKFHGYTFQYKPRGRNTGIHELAEQLGSIDGKISYPTMCFLNPQNEIIYQHEGFVDPDTLLKILERLK